MRKSIVLEGILLCKVPFYAPTGTPYRCPQSKFLPDFVQIQISTRFQLMFYLCLSSFYLDLIFYQLSSSFSPVYYQILFLDLKFIHFSPNLFRDFAQKWLVKLQIMFRYVFPTWQPCMQSNSSHGLDLYHLQSCSRSGLSLDYVQIMSR